MESPFEVLEIDPDADEETIEAAYRRRVIETHPDQGGSVDALRAVRAAYEAITNGEYDRDDGSSREAVRDAAETRRERREDRPFAEVEYLNYAVLDDYGWGLDDGDLFEKAATEGLDPIDHGRFVVEPHESLLEAAENRGFAWPFACRGGACANCAVAVIEGELAMPVNTILPPELMDRGFRLSCNGVPLTDELKIVFNVKHIPGLDELRLPPYPFELAHADD